MKTKSTWTFNQIRYRIQLASRRWDTFVFIVPGNVVDRMCEELQVTYSEEHTGVLKEENSIHFFGPSATRNQQLLHMRPASGFRKRPAF